MVSVTSARAVIISSDYSRIPVEGDAQCVRTAVLLDEMCVATHGSQNWMQGVGPVVVAQVRKWWVLLLLLVLGAAAGASCVIK